MRFGISPVLFSIRTSLLSWASLDSSLLSSLPTTPLSCGNGEFDGGASGLGAGAVFIAPAPSIQGVGTGSIGFSGRCWPWPAVRPSGVHVFAVPSGWNTQGGCSVLVEDSVPVWTSSLLWAVRPLWTLDGWAVGVGRLLVGRPGLPCPKWLPWGWFIHLHHGSHGCLGAHLAWR